MNARVFSFSGYCRVVWVCLAALLCLQTEFSVVHLPVASAQTEVNSQAPPQWILRKIGGFEGQEALFVEESGRLHVYSQGELPWILDLRSGQYEPSSSDGLQPPLWRGNTYHEVYHLENGQWVRKYREFSAGPEQPLHFGSCDRDDRLNLPIEKEIRRELPSPIKIKAIRKFKGHVLVVYSDTSQALAPGADHPPIEVDLLLPDKNGWQIAGSQEADDYGFFCGTRTFPTELASGDMATVLLVFTGYRAPHNDDYTATSFLAGDHLPPAPEEPERTADGKGQAAELKPDWSLEQLFGNGYFTALHGRYFLEDGRLHVYRALPTVPNPKTHQLEPSPEENELKPFWKGEPYYHEIYRLEDGEWVPRMWEALGPDGREFSQPPERYLDFGSCDTNDRIDLPGSEIKKALGPRLKIKTIAEFGDYAAVVYSTPKTGQGRRRSDNDEGTLQVALLVHGKTGWELTVGGAVLTHETFCGAKTLTTIRGGNARQVLLIFSVDGDYHELHSFVLD